MRKLITIIALSLVPLVATAAEEVTPIGNNGVLLNAVALNAGASSLTFYLGKDTKDATPTSATDTSTGNVRLRDFDYIRLEVSYDYTATELTITLTCTEGQTRATATGVIPTATYASGVYTLAVGGVITTPSMAADTIYPVVFKTRHADVIKCVVSSSGAPGATDKVTVTGWAIKSKGI